ncbi:nucleotidyltransferase family protein [Thermosynechococcaceae cyanobacterium BACA0444]|uniref:Nucleotidyltransferase family protein n=1 Tax=Pseudocalidococcus azoricus BACA0444 TaxID=2918990 RepID=A0AAE4FS79_9CYAN|nr:nucleotidyltransferase family protein [Pseudocalidococcus azoricus]MDS3861151.1 nucleotidyltransferase family protein [Pseudocalidococcus azoricus BACA0444]
MSITQANRLLSGGNYQATPEQILLLRASLWPGERAIHAWQAWIQQVDFENLDAGSNRLLPLLYRNLSQLGVEHPTIEKLKGIYRHTWSMNQLRVQRLRKVLEKFQEANIPTVLLKGMSLCIADYQDWGVRPMADMDVLVPPELTEKAMMILMQNGWKSTHYNSDKAHEHISLRHASGLRDQDGWSLDLHWRVFQNSFTLCDQKVFWDDSQLVKFMGLKTRILKPIDRFLHVCVHGSCWSPEPPIRWIADALTIYNKQDFFNWLELVKRTNLFSLNLPLLTTLNYLNDNLELSVPRNIFIDINHHSATKKEKFAHYIRTNSSVDVFSKNPLNSILAEFMSLQLMYQSFNSYPGQLSKPKKNLLSFLWTYFRSEFCWKKLIHRINKLFNTILIVFFKICR